MRLIDADALKPKCFYDEDSGEPYIYLQELDEIPTIDAVEVVRCKDCKYRSTFNTFCWVTDTEVPDDHFCSYGERREP